MLGSRIPRVEADGPSPLSIYDRDMSRQAERYGWPTKIGVGLDNIFDRAPPFSVTVFGFNGGLYSALGRSYRVSLSVPY